MYKMNNTKIKTNKKNTWNWDFDWWVGNTISFALEVIKSQVLVNVTIIFPLRSCRVSHTCSIYSIINK